MNLFPSPYEIAMSTVNITRARDIDSEKQLDETRKKITRLRGVLPTLLSNSSEPNAAEFLERARKLIDNLHTKIDEFHAKQTQDEQKSPALT